MLFPHLKGLITPSPWSPRLGASGSFQLRPPRPGVQLRFAALDGMGPVLESRSWIRGPWFFSGRLCVESPFLMGKSTITGWWYTMVYLPLWKMWKYWLVTVGDGWWRLVTVGDGWWRLVTVGDGWWRLVTAGGFSQLGWWNSQYMEK